MINNVMTMILFLKCACVCVYVCNIIMGFQAMKDMWRLEVNFVKSTLFYSCGDQDELTSHTHQRNCPLCSLADAQIRLVELCQ